MIIIFYFLRFPFCATKIRNPHGGFLYSFAVHDFLLILIWSLQTDSSAYLGAKVPACRSQISIPAQEVHFTFCHLFSHLILGAKPVSTLSSWQLCLTCVKTQGLGAFLRRAVIVGLSFSKTLMLGHGFWGRLSSHLPTMKILGAKQ